MPAASSLMRGLGATAAALLFSVHPLRVESVVWITERRDLTSGFFFLLAVISYLEAHAHATPRPGWRLVSLGATVLALGSKTIVMVRSGQVAALSQYDTQYAMVENAGVKLRVLDTRDIDRYPSNGLLALEETLKARPKEAAAVARGYARGTVFAINNPEAAIRMLYEVYPQTRPTGKDEATAIRDDVRVLQARIVNWKLDKAGVSKWGENSETNYAAYAEFLLKWGVIKQKVDVHDLITNELIGSINNFDPAKVAAEARAYKW